MKKTNLKLVVLAFFCALSINSLTAQNNKQKTKLTITERTLSADGSNSMKKLIKVGAAAEKHLKKLNLDKYTDENSISELTIKK